MLLRVALMICWEAIHQRIRLLELISLSITKSWQMPLKIGFQKIWTKNLKILRMF